MEYWTFDELRKYADTCQLSWITFKNSFNDENVQAFLKKSYPVICAEASQLELPEVNPITIASKAPAIIVQDRVGRAFIDMCNAYAAADDKSQDKANLKERLEKSLRGQPLKCEILLHQIAFLRLRLLRCPDCAHCAFGGSFIMNSRRLLTPLTKLFDFAL